MNAADWTNQQIQALLTALAANTQQGINDPATQNAILAWMADPFDPHMIASTRISAYGKATVMKFLDNLIAWGDSLYAQYTAETVNQAEQLYILADMILGPAPDLVRLPATQQQTAPTYASLHGLDLFSNILVNIENVVVAPEPPQSIVQGSGEGTDPASSLPQFPGTGNTLLFCIPPNTQLLAYWDKVAQRLYNIRHCLNLAGRRAAAAALRAAAQSAAADRGPGRRRRRDRRRLDRADLSLRHLSAEGGRADERCARLRGADLAGSGKAGRRDAVRRCTPPRSWTSRSIC